MRPIIIVVFLYFYGLTLLGQNVNQVSLTERQIAKLEKLKSPSLKLKKYRKYYTKDSLRAAKKYERFLNKKWKDIDKEVEVAGNKKVRSLKKKGSETLSIPKSSDSLSRFLRNANLKPGNYLSGTKIDTSLHFLSNKNKPFPGAQGDSLSLRGLSQSSLKTPSFNNYFKGAQIAGLKELSQVKGGLGKYNTRLNQYQKQYGGYLKNDSTRKAALEKETSDFEKEAQQKVMNTAYTGEMLKYQKQIDALKSQQKYKTQAAQLQDSTYRKKMAKENAEKFAMKYLNEDKQLLNSVQSKMQLLMKKYSVVPNSNDLSSAVKRTSLKGKTFRERLVFATNFQVLSYNPVAIDFSLMAGYKFNTRFVAGGGVNYRQTFGSIGSAVKFAPQIFGYKIFTSYDIVRRFFIYGEFDRNSIAVKSNDNTALVWKNAAIGAVGRKISVSHKIDMTMLVGYNFFHQNNDPIYPQPWILRVGFQLSDGAMMKRKPDVKIF